jgi:hypothetical protein
VVDASLGERGEQLLERFWRVLRALLGRDATPRVPRGVGQVEIADVREPDDERLVVRGRRMLAAGMRGVKRTVPARPVALGAMVPRST